MSDDGFSYQGVKINLNRLRRGVGDVALLCVHGFSGSAEDWREFADALKSDVSVFAIDLPGHGKSERPPEREPYTEEYLVGLMDATMQRLPVKRRVPTGYSMGGRLALAYAISHPGRSDALALIGATPGLRDPDERKARRDADEELARFVESRPIEDFVTRWEDSPLFETRKRLPNEKRERIRQNKLRNDPSSLACSLRGFGTGAMTPLWDRLEELAIPTLLITGALDEKFCEINEETLNYLAFGEWRTVADSGHAAIDEKPEATAAAVDEFLSRVEFKQ
jgi:2-succinyl-6-hydroxy-2,4-cyclohexadiene-1-carboxylate synthase